MAKKQLPSPRPSAEPHSPEPTIDRIISSLVSKSALMRQCCVLATLDDSAAIVDSTAPTADAKDAQDALRFALADLAIEIFDTLRQLQGQLPADVGERTLIAGDGGAR